MKKSTVNSSSLIDRSNSLLLGAVTCGILLVCPTDNVVKIGLAVGAVRLLNKSGELLDAALDNDQRRHFENELNKA